jgi:uncharacterized protein
MNRVVHFDLQVDDINRAQKFYQKVFGWKFKQAMKKEDGGMDYWLIETGKGKGIDGGVMQRPNENEDKFYRFSCTIEVADIDVAIKAVKENGGSIEMEKSELKGVGFFASVKDTEGNQFALMQSTGQPPK